MKTKTNGFRSSVTSSVMALAAAAAVAAVFVIAPVTGQDAPAPAPGGKGGGGFGGKGGGGGKQAVPRSRSADCRGQAGHVGILEWCAAGRRNQHRAGAG